MIYFASDVHLGLAEGDPAEREARFSSWLRSLLLKPGTEALYLLGDIWDFWYEYRDVIPREGVRVVAALAALVDAGIPVYYFPGNHDVWLYSFWQDLGVQVLQQPQRVILQGKRLLLGHGDGLGTASRSYNFMLKVFHSKLCQKLFSTLHPWIAFRIAKGWSNSNRRSHSAYRFKGEEEPLFRYCVRSCAEEHADYCIFGHFHDAVDMPLPSAAGGAPSRLVVLKDWISGGEPHAELEGGELSVFVR